MDLRVVVEEVGGWSVVRVHGDVDVASAPLLREQTIMAESLTDVQDAEDPEGYGFGVRRHRWRCAEAMQWKMA